MRKKSRSDEDPPGTVAAWIVTFSDCMTLLLCFFVMMVTFSSFDEESLQKIAGAFESRSYAWVFPIEREIKDSAVRPVDRPVDRTAEGSETPTESEQEMIQCPRPPVVIIDTDAYRDRHVFCIRSERLFFGKGSSLTPAGRKQLGMIASFMRLVPCRVIISESGAADGGGRKGAPMERAWAVMNHFVNAEGLPGARFNISAAQAPPAGRFRGQSVVKIALLARSVYE